MIRLISHQSMILHRKIFQNNDKLFKNMWYTWKYFCCLMNVNVDKTSFYCCWKYFSKRWQQQKIFLMKFNRFQRWSNFIMRQILHEIIWIIHSLFLNKTVILDNICLNIILLNKKYSFSLPQIDRRNKLLLHNPYLIELLYTHSFQVIERSS